MSSRGSSTERFRHTYTGDNAPPVKNAKIEISYISKSHNEDGFTRPRDGVQPRQVIIKKFIEISSDELTT